MDRPTTIPFMLPGRAGGVPLDSVAGPPSRVPSCTRAGLQLVMRRVESSLHQHGTTVDSWPVRGISRVCDCKSLQRNPPSAWAPTCQLSLSLPSIVAWHRTLRTLKQGVRRAPRPASQRLDNAMAVSRCSTLASRVKKLIHANVDYFKVFEETAVGRPSVLRTATCQHQRTAPLHSSHPRGP
jgi:hypothetical protein